MTGDLTIYVGENAYDAYTEWGVSLSDGSISALLTPPQLKEFPNNESRLEDGTRYNVISPKFAQRDVTLEIHMVSNSLLQMLQKYASFCAMLKNGEFALHTALIPDMTFRFIYQSCSQFSQLGGIAKYTLKLIEPDPTNRVNATNTSPEETVEQG